MVMERYGQPLKSQSFSSALLDAIYRSTDEDELILYKTTTMRKSHSTRQDDRSRDHNNLKRACRVEKWTEKKVSEKPMPRRKASELERLDHSDGFRKFQHKLHLQSSSPSSDSSDNETNYGFSSSETESVQVTRASANRAKPVRTTVLTRLEKAEKPPPPTIPMRSSSTSSVKERNPKTKDEGDGFSKSRAARFYSEFKKARQPSSPGSKLASFLNSLFMSGSAKKAKLSSQTRNNELSSYDSSESKSNQVSSSSSSASSYSRSCLSKTPSSKTPSNGVRRSVRFYPTTVIVDEDSRPCGQKFVYLPEEQKSLTASKVPSLSEKVKLHLLEKTKQDEEATKDLFKEYQKNNDFFRRDLGEDDRDDDDAASCSSSDLFELENLAVIGIERYQEELPVFETTNLKTNQAIAKGLIL